MPNGSLPALDPATPNGSLPPFALPATPNGSVPPLPAANAPPLVPGGVPVLAPPALMPPSPEPLEPPSLTTGPIGPVGDPTGGPWSVSAPQANERCAIVAYSANRAHRRRAKCLMVQPFDTLEPRIASVAFGSAKSIPLSAVDSSTSSIDLRRSRRWRSSPSSDRSRRSCSRMARPTCGRTKRGATPQPGEDRASKACPS